MLRAAVEFADAHGIEALSMRRLAKELGVEAMSLYNHVANKDEILSGIVEIVAGEVAVPSTRELEDLDPSERDLGARRVHPPPLVCSLMTSTPSVVPSRMRWMEGVLATLREAGFSPT